jgi:hypothetical protein
MSIPFWSNDPTVLFNKAYILEIFPTTDMYYEQKMNSVTRLIIVISLLGYFFSRTIRIPIAGLSMIAVIYFIFKSRKYKVTRDMTQEGFKQGGGKQGSDSRSSIVNPETLESVLKSEYKEGNKKNPFSNVLLTQITDEPNRKAAPPAFNVEVDEDITKNVKKAVQFMNPEIKNTSKQLYGDLYENFELDQSNRAFFSTANTRVENDQKSFGDFLYGNMPSSKESNAAGAMQRVADSYRYTLY